MDWLIGLLLLVAGVVIGFFAARYWFLNSGEAAELQEQVANVQQQFEAYRKDVSEQLATARQIASEVTDIQHRLNLFLQDSQQLLEQNKEWQQPLPFFAEETIRSIRQANILNKERREDSERTEDGEPPRDYSEPGSGLFSPPVKEEKSN
ncbi:YhcB family protein [Aliidiomarina sanyensis]|uniref:Z-ring associated protein G n=1 Tax=Aliidiomarina sanyensis TaxID=1249555 RepID=A0A432WI67_9GAMM|nr:DUF1043 family protein [Aliidiomarina sanyensis]RUO33463.1 DUF1043 domain-containing protein [Aliidiomarina sanyensis]